MVEIPHVPAKFGRCIKLPNNGSFITKLLYQYRRDATKRGIGFHLERDTVDRLVRMPCHYCGVLNSNTIRKSKRAGVFHHNGIDRMDPLLPYEAGNVVPCCGTCNMSKRQMNREDFLAWVARVHCYSTRTNF